MPTGIFPLLCLVLILGAGPALAAGDPASLCDEAARRVASESDVPLEVLLAITRVETGRGSGRDVYPWPWTINQAGTGQWFETAQEATEAADSALAGGTGNLDVGCFQLNHRWHGNNFASLDQMFDPLNNARYAAAFLTRLFREKGDWTAAVAAYHSRNEGPAGAYLERIEAVMADLGQSVAPREAVPNAYPLLQAGSRGSAGSLVPLLAAGRPLIGAAP